MTASQRKEAYEKMKTVFLQQTEVYNQKKAAKSKLKGTINTIRLANGLGKKS